MIIHDNPFTELDVEGERCLRAQKQAPWQLQLIFSILFHVFSDFFFLYSLIFKTGHGICSGQVDHDLRGSLAQRTACAKFAPELFLSPTAWPWRSRQVSNILQYSH
jgi:hypothetical protein